MKSGPVVVTLAGLVLLGGVAYAFVRDGGGAVVEQASVAAAQQASKEVVHVDDLAEAPEQYEGEIVLRAVVSAVNKAEGVFAVIDSREFESCGVLSCAENYLPVKASNVFPKPRTVVEITGQIAMSDRGLVFEAKRVEPVR